MKKYLFSITVSMFACVSPPTISKESQESLICNYPFGTHCSPTTHCNSVCFPDTGYCPEYTLDELNWCHYDDNDFPCNTPQYHERVGCSGCEPVTHYCFPGEQP